MTTALTEPGTASGAAYARRWWALAVLASVQFMVVANLTTVNVALPSVQADLHLTGAGLAWVVFALAAAGLPLLSRVPAHDADALDLVPAMLLVALGLGLGLPALQGAALHGSAVADAGMAAGVVACVQQLGAAAGLAVLTTLAFRRAASAGSGGIPDQAAAVAGYQFASRLPGSPSPPAPSWRCS